MSRFKLLIIIISEEWGVIVVKERTRVTTCLGLPEAVATPRFLLIADRFFDV